MGKNEPDVGIQLDQGEEFNARFFDAAFHAQPVEQRALGLLRLGQRLDQAPNEMGSNRRSALFHL